MTLALSEFQRVTTRSGVQIAWASAGDGPPVLVPAMSWLAEDLLPLAVDRTLIFYDIRSQGRSDHMLEHQIGFERDLADTEDLLAALELERVALLGWSYYGAVMARYAFSHPEQVSQLALLGPLAPRAQPHWNQYLENLSRSLDMQALADLEKQRRAGLRTADPVAWCKAHTRLFLRVYVSNDAALAQMRSCPCVEPNLDPEVVNKQTLRVIEGMALYDWRDEMRGMSTPTLILHGDRDAVPIAGSHEWLEVLADARLEVLHGRAHMPWLEQPEDFFGPLDQFLARGDTNG